MGGAKGRVLRRRMRRKNRMWVKDKEDKEEKGAGKEDEEEKEGKQEEERKQEK